jgi:23S rRNA (pseudouridine1915-N3)-methyltransferase
LQIQIVSVGKLREKYLKDACSEYLKRNSRFCSIKVIEVAEEKVPETLTKAQKETVLKKEAERIKNVLPKNTFTIVLDLKGEKPDSIKFSQQISSWMLEGKSNITFIIGGSIGLDRQLVQESNYSLCLSDLTFPHQLVRVILLEQIYRCFKIINNEPYHK